jgi:4-methyl-5(b-hydroxyethyl)-thiazole monophosphate biosynthesis
MTKALVPLADGVEEMEAVIAIDVLRRAGWEVCAAGLKPGPVIASRGVKLLPDKTWDEIDPDSFDLIVLPGGAQGTENLRRDPRVLRALQTMAQGGKIIAAVCAAPLVLQDAGLLAGKNATCHPGVAAKLTATARSADRVVTDGRIVTSQGAGTTFEFALALVTMIDGPAKAGEIARAIVLH